MDLAATVAERLAAGWHPEEGPEAATRADALMALWSERSARGDSAAFARRLAWDGLDPGALRRVLAPGHRREGPLPAWLSTFREVSEIAAHGAVEAVEADNAPWRDPAAPI
ncbi:MAG TPA: hypothetical protein VKM72_12530, partial [Thermoanaerobaculia bacterium]|nr:hypothetical protein [Thermoanaerobaculia bacterium]